VIAVFTRKNALVECLDYQIPVTQITSLSDTRYSAKWSKREWIASLRSGMRRRESQYLRKKEKPMWSSIKTVDGFKRRNPVRTTSRLTKNHRERPRNALRAADEKLSLRAISLKLREVLRVRIVSSKKLTQVSVVQVTITVNHVISVT